MLRDYEIEVCLKGANKNVFTKSYNVTLRDDFVNGEKLKQHTIHNHVNNFIKQLKLNSLPVAKRAFAKREIYAVDYGINTGSEINGVRPSLIVRIDTEKEKTGGDVIVVPLTSALAYKLVDTFDVSVPKSDSNKLFQTSYARLRQVRAISTRKIGDLLGILTDKRVQKAIEDTMKVMFGLQ